MVDPMLNQGDQVAISGADYIPRAAKAALALGVRPMATLVILGLRTGDGSVLTVDRTPKDAALVDLAAVLETSQHEREQFSRLTCPLSANPAYQGNPSV